MKKIKQILKYKNLILVVSFISAIILSLSVVSPVVAGIKKGMDLHANCIKTVFPDDVERGIAIDPDGGTILVEYEENGIKKEVMLNLRKDSKFSECTDGARELITLAQNTASKIESDTCKELKEITSGVQPIPMLDGKKMDIKASNNYISKYCQ